MADLDREEREEDWLEVRRFTDRIAAEMIRDFLADHDVRVGLHGNPNATRMTWSASTEVFRIVVMREDLERANEALAAMTAGDQHPFRGPVPPSEEEEEEEEPASKEYVAPKRALFAMMLAIIVPIGAGHFFTQHTAAAKVLCLGMVVAFVLALFGSSRGHIEFFRIWGILVLFDVVGSFFAARRYNRRAIPNEGTQVIGAFFAVVAAFVLSFVVGELHILSPAEPSRVGSSGARRGVVTEPPPTFRARF